ncbi:unnamed protein product [Polarella glacialis]|uniref:Golvesin/Xly CBD-like domain-containing protein n=1 Tax=Polarella glacialis TaxID=89957 RepID=A0A813F6B6_POLGL|nr:unnamed protein product [Polarella glacialis]
MALLVAVLASLATIALGTRIVLDDSDSTLSTSSANTFAGTYQPCMQDAYKGQFHHDWANNKGGASFEFKFDVPQDGCYSLEEHHPGGENNEMCSQYMPSNTRLDVGWCKGRNSTLYVDQSRKGAQWNSLGSFPFYVGWQGSLKTSNAVGETCAAGNCFWVVDAFRLTRVGDACTSELEQQLKGEGSSVSSAQVLPSPVASTASSTSAVTPITTRAEGSSVSSTQVLPSPVASTASSTSAVTPITTRAEGSSVSSTQVPPSPVASTASSTSAVTPITTRAEESSVFLQAGLQAGSLRLTVEMNPSSTAGLLADLKAQTGVFEDTLKTQLGAVSVRVENIEALAVEGMDRRLQATSAPFKVSFKAEVPSSGLWARKGLVSELSLALAAAGATLKVRSAELTWPQTTVDGAGSVEFDYIPLVVVGVVLAFTAISVLLGIYWTCKSRKSVEPSTDVEEGSKQGEGKPEEPESLDKENKEKENIYIDDNASTVSPASEQSVDTA